MLLYLFKIKNELSRLEKYADNLKSKFEADTKSNDLLIDTKNLHILYENIQQILPESIQKVSNFSRHISWMKKRLKENKPELCKSDIDDICNIDIPEIEDAFIKWCEKPEYFDEELSSSISDLLLSDQLDSVIRKSFVILKSRLCNIFNQNTDIDGPELVNNIFGSSSRIELSLSKSEKQSVRDLLSGLFGVFRNRYAHNDTSPSLDEVDAIVSMINYFLTNVENFKKQA